MQKWFPTKFQLNHQESFRYTEEACGADVVSNLATNHRIILHIFHSYVHRKQRYSLYSIVLWRRRKYNFFIPVHSPIMNILINFPMLLMCRRANSLLPSNSSPSSPLYEGVGVGVSQRRDCLQKLLATSPQTERLEKRHSPAAPKLLAGSHCFQCVQE